jgi:hypothetical protein
MRTRTAAAILFFICAGLLHSQPAHGKRVEPAASAVRAEDAIVAAVREQARGDDDDAIDGLILQTPDKLLGVAPSVALARRTVAVCGMLRNDNEYEKATRLAQRTVRKLAKMTEVLPEDRVERLYSEAWLEAKIIDNKARALQLLEAASVIAPDDERIAVLQLRVVAALSAFGR